MHNDDIELIALMRRDTERGFDCLVKAYTERIYWHIRRMVVSFDDTEDIVQETFLRIFKSFKSFRGECSLASWIYRIATNEALRFIESRERHGAINLIEEYQDTAAETYIDLSNQTAILFQTAIQSLPRKQQIAFNLRYYDELSYEEIGDIIASSATAAKANYHEAKKKIQDYLLNHIL